MSSCAHIQIQDSSGVGEARRAAVRFAEEVGFTEVRSGAVAIVATELASNLIKHVKGGDIFLQLDDRLKKLYLIAHDEGGGIENLRLCMQAGYSTSQTAGNGLGAISSLPDECDIYSRIDNGTTIVCAFELSPSLVPSSIIYGGLNIPYPGETVSGDAWDVAVFEDYALAIVADGLGHGPEAHEASSLALETFGRHLDKTPSDILSRIHTALLRTRGAAVAIARIDFEKSMLVYTGIGNISAQVLDQDSVKSLVSRDGIVGQNARKFDAVTYSWSEHSTLLMFSDGLTSRARIDPLETPGLEFHTPYVVAARLLKTYLRGRDDATILVASHRARRKESDL